MRFYFSLQDKAEFFPDREGDEHANIDAASASAREWARELAVEDLRCGLDVADRAIEISDTTGNVVAKVGVRATLFKA